MELTWLGLQACSLTSDGVTCLIDPAKKIPLPSKASFSVLTDSDRDLYDARALEAGYCVDWPGEFEVQEHLIVGVEVPDISDGAIHTMMAVTTKDHVTVAFPGLLPHLPEAKLLEKLGTVHVLVLPLSRDLKIEELASLVDTISPNIVVPLYEEDQDAHLQAFLKHYSQGSKEAETTLKMKKPETSPDTPDIVLLDPKNR